MITTKRKYRYPVKAGTVFCLTQPKRLFNKTVGAYLEYRCYIWIIKEGERRQIGRPEKDRPIRVVIYFKPIAKDYQEYYILRQPEWMQYDSVAKRLKPGYKVISKNCNYDYKGLNVRRFYQVIGALWKKLGKGEHAPILIREGKYHSLYEYCLQDVRLIRGLFEFALTNMYLMDGEASIIEMGKLDYSAVPAKLFADRMKQKKEMEDAKEAKDDREEDAPDILGEV